MSQKNRQTHSPKSLETPQAAAGQYAVSAAGNQSAAAGIRPPGRFWNAFQPDILGDTSAYRSRWGSRFNFFHTFVNDHKRWAEHMAQKTLYWTGIAEVYSRALRCRGATIQMYHSVCGPEEFRWMDPRFTIPPGEFEAQMRFLSLHRNVLAYSALIDLLERGEEPPAGSVVITFDDGYLDTLRVAAPILEKYGLPAVAFLVTGYIDRGQTQWSDDVFSLFVAHTRTTVRIPEISPTTVNLCDDRAKAEAYDATLLWFMSASSQARTKMLADLAEEFRPECMPPRLTMNWDEVREMRRKHPGIEIGLHGAEHLDMTAHGDDVVRNELDQCLGSTERELGIRPDHFAFPYNRVSPAARALVRQFGFRSAVASGNGVLISSASDRYALPRMETCRSMTLFRFRTGGAHPGLSRALLRHP